MSNIKHGARVCNESTRSTYENTMEYANTMLLAEDKEVYSSQIPRDHLFCLWGIGTNHSLGLIRIDFVSV
eukprot:scaffold3950_cov100-Skeletonema_dohrnii-CCMP3373.AAC.1